MARALTSTDHERIALNLGLCSFIFFLAGGVLALVMRAQRSSSNGQVVFDNTYSELFTMHGSTMIYLFVTPMAIAPAMYMVPLQIGALPVAGARAALGGFWIWLAGGVVMQSGWLTSDGAGRDGWFSYVPLSESSNTPGVGQDVWVLGVILAAVARLRCSMLFGLTFFVQFLIGGLSGISVASPVLDYAAHSTYFVIAHFHYTLFAGSVFGFFAGVYHWFPNVTGAMLRERLGKLQLAFMIVGTKLTFFPMFLLGQDGMPRRIWRYAQHPGWVTLNRLETVGAGLIAAGILVFMANVVVSLRSRVTAGGDPWLGHTLEWATSSPVAKPRTRLIIRGYRHLTCLSCVRT